MITMFEAATNTNSSSGDDIIDGCNLQGIYEKDKGLTIIDYILLYVIDMHISPDFIKGYTKITAEISKAAAITS